MLNKDISMIVYTHTDCEDVWPLFFGQTAKYMPGANKVIFTNRKTESIPEDYRVVLYDDTLSYADRFASCLKKIDTHLCMIHHEDMMLYSEPDISRLNEYVDVMRNDNLDFVKLIKGGEARDIPYPGHKDLFFIPLDSEWIFAIQPTIWRTNRLLQIYDNFPNTGIWDLEIRSQGLCRVLGMRGVYSWNSEGSKRGMFHYDSMVYPYVATAVVKGEWNTSEYPNELSALFEEYKIDPNKRGTR